MQSQLTQSIFTLNQDGSLSTHIKDQNWNLRNIQKEDTSNYVSLFGDAKVMKSFGDGNIRSEEDTKKRIGNVWLPRVKKGQPHAAMSIFGDNGEFIGHFIAGGGDHEGASEVAYAIHKKFWGKKITSTVMSTIIEKWAPLVQNIGNGKGENEFNNPIVQQNFCCFMGKPLTQMDATHNLDNIASAKVLSNNAFTAAQYNVTSGIVIDYENKDFDTKNPQSLITIEQDIIKNYFNPKSAIETLQKNTRYKFRDPDGGKKTISFSEKYNKIKCHVERQVESQR